MLTRHSLSLRLLFYTAAGATVWAGYAYLLNYTNSDSNVVGLSILCGATLGFVFAWLNRQ